MSPPPLKADAYDRDGRAEQVLEAVLDYLTHVAEPCEAGDARGSGIVFSAVLHGPIGLSPEGRPVATLIFEKHTLQSWTAMVTIVSLIGFTTVLVISP